MEKEKIKKLNPSFNLEWDYYGYKNDKTCGVYSQLDWNQRIMETINESFIEFLKVNETKPNTLIVSYNMYSFFDTLEYFHVVDGNINDNDTPNSFEKIGTLKNRFSVYCSEYLPPNTIYVLNYNNLTNKENSEINCGVIKINVEEQKNMIIRISEKKLSNYKQLCELNGFTMSKRIRKFIDDEIALFEDKLKK